MNSEQILAIEARLETGLYPKRPVAVVRGEGARLWDAEGRMLIDCVGGQGAANLGHANPAIVAAIAAQAARLISCPEILPNDARAEYLQALAAALPLPARIFLCNSGAEAVEAAIKFARLLTGRTGVLATMRGFHGRTMGALSATWEPKYREPFEPLVPGFRHVAFNDVAAIEAAIDTQTAAVIVEPVQGEGGVRPATSTFLEAARARCSATGAVLIVDEIQTGFGRTGQLWGCEHFGIEPDMVCLAKSIAGGLPMGAVAIHARYGGLPSGAHGSTFGGNPLACAAATAALQYLHAHDLPTQAARKGAWLLERLRALRLPRVREVRGMGLLIGIELRERVQPFLIALFERGVLALPAGPTVLRLLPPLVIADEDLAFVADQIESVLR